MRCVSCTLYLSLHLWTKIFTSSTKLLKRHIRIDNILQLLHLIGDRNRDLMDEVMRSRFFFHVHLSPYLWTLVFCFLIIFLQPPSLRFSFLLFQMFQSGQLPRAVNTTLRFFVSMLVQRKYTATRISQVVRNRCGTMAREKQ